MHHRQSGAASFVAALILSASIAATQSTQLRRELDLSYVPTIEEAVQAMLRLADVKKTDIVYDLGCGDGRIVIAAAECPTGEWARFVVACSQEVMPMPAPARAMKSTIKMPSPEERIRRRAYELYVRRGNQSGSELDDWLQAEKEFLQDEAIDENAAEMFGQP